MKYKAMHVALVALAAALVADPALAQQEGHQAGHSATSGAEATTTDAAGTMSCRMMSRMKAIAAGRAEISRLLDEAMKTQAAMEAEKAPPALRAVLAQHGALLRQLQAKLQTEAKETGPMCGMAGTAKGESAPAVARGVHAGGTN